MFYYGMKRYFGIGCQPSGQVEVLESSEVEQINNIVKPNIKFVDVVVYEEPLNEDEIKKYELFDLKNKMVGFIA